MNKILIIFLFSTITIAFAELPSTYQQQQQRYRQQRFRQFARQEVAPQPTDAPEEQPPPQQPEDTTSETDDSTATAGVAPYPPSGYRPPGRAFVLPSESVDDEEEQGGRANEDENNNNGEATTESNNNGPYPPSGWKPSGRLLALPARQSSGQPSTNYGAPQTPQQEYGTPANEGGDDNDDAAATTTNEPDSEVVEVEDIPAEINANQPDESQAAAAGSYYVQLPDGTLQRVVYLTENDLQNAAVTAAKLQIQPVFQQLIAQPVAQSIYSTIPRAVSYSSQYQSW